MLKRIIFDLDDTLVVWKSDYSLLLKKILEEKNIDMDYLIIDNAIEAQEIKYDYLSKEQLLSDINAGLDKKVTMDLVNEILERQKVLSEHDEKTIDVLKYLASKYEIVVLTNYFKDTQEGRLEHAGFMPYIKEVFGGDTIGKTKPNAAGFIMAMGDYTAGECLMIGDCLPIDINGAKNVGIKTILIDRNNKYPNYQGTKITNLEELKEML